MLLRLALLLLASTAAAEWRPGQNKPAEHFDNEISKHFLGSAKRSYCLRKAKKKNLPLLVLLTRPGCGACQNLKQSVNRGTELKALAASGKLLLVLAEGDAQAQWQAEGQVLTRRVLTLLVLLLVLTLSFPAL